MKPGEFIAIRKTDSDDVVDQDAIAVNVPVVLNQHVHVTFIIKDGQESKSKKDLISEFIAPAVSAEARFIDQIVLGQYSQFLANGTGHLNIPASRASLTKLGQVMNENKAYADGRNLILTPSAQNDLLNVDLFVQAQQVGDDGTALSEAYIGRKFGFNTYMSNNAPSITSGNSVIQGAVNNAAGYPAGTTTITVDGLTAAIPVNSWFTVDTGTVAGDDTPQRVISSVGGATPTSITFWPGLKNAVADNAVVTRYVPGQINAAGGYAAGYAKQLTVDTFTVAPRVGQLVTFGTSTSNDLAVNPIYTIIYVNGLVGIVLDRPLAVGVADDDKVNIGPSGHYNFAFHRNAIALVVRPLAMPMQGTGARAATVNFNGLSMRACITYDGKAQGHRVTLDLLCGVKVLDLALGGIVYS